MEKTGMGSKAPAASAGAVSADARTASAQNNNATMKNCREQLLPRSPKNFIAHTVLVLDAVITGKVCVDYICKGRSAAG